jgi:hypothetical protein
VKNKTKKFRLVKVQSSKGDEVSLKRASRVESEPESEFEDSELNYVLGVRLQDMLDDMIDTERRANDLTEPETSDDSETPKSRVSRISKISQSPKARKPLNLILKTLQEPFKCSGGIPEIPFLHFIERFRQLGGITTPKFITAYIYMRRAMSKLQLRDPECLHKLFSCCVLAAHKYTTDTEFWYLEDWAKLAGVNVEELKKQEHILVSNVLKFKLFVSEEIYLKTKRCLKAYARTI